MSARWSDNSDVQQKTQFVGADPPVQSSISWGVSSTADGPLSTHTRQRLYDYTRPIVDVAK